MSKTSKQALERARRVVAGALGGDYALRARETIADDIVTALSKHRVLAGTQQKPPRRVAPDKVGFDADGQWKLWETSTHTVVASCGEHDGIALVRHTGNGMLTPAQAHELSRVLDTAAQLQPNLKRPN